MRQNRLILLVDDCEDTGALVKRALQPYQIEQCFTISDAEKMLLNSEFDLILIDVSLPDGNGIDFCQKISGQTNLKQTPKLMLTADSDVSRKVYGLYSGADDYIVKPFAGPELKARVDARLRVLESLNQTEFEVGGIVLDLRNLKAVDALDKKRDLLLTPTEFRILYALVQNLNKTLTREEIIQQVWKENRIHIAKRGIDSHISRIRKKLPRDRFDITSTYTLGYSLALKRA